MYPYCVPLLGHKYLPAMFLPLMHQVLQSLPLLRFHLFAFKIDRLFFKILFCWNWLCRFRFLLILAVFDIIICNISSFTFGFPFFFNLYLLYKLSWCFFFIFPRKHLLVLKSSSKRLQRNNFPSSITSWGRLEDVLEIGLEDVLEDEKMSWRHILQTSWRYALKTSSRRLGDKQNVYWEYLYLTDINLYLVNLYLTYLHLTNQGECIS